MRVAEIVGHWTGAKASALRLAMRMTGEEFAGRLGVTPRGVGKWDSAPDLVLAMNTHRLLDTVLATLSEAEQSRFTMLLRDAGTQVASCEAESSPPVLPPPLALPAPPTVDLETVSYLRSSLQSLYVTDNRIGPRVLLPAITAHLRTIEALTEHAVGSVLDQLLEVGAAYAEFAGWLHHDSGDLASAATWCARGLEWADLAGDARMSSFILMRRAAQSISSRNGEYAVRFARAAQRKSGEHTTRVHVIAALTEAHGHALCGNSGEVERAVDVAAALIEGGAHAADGDPTSGRYCELPLYSKITQAKCHLELRHGGAAITAFNGVLCDLSDEYRRDRGQYMASLAKAHLMAEQPEQACAVAENALTIAISTGSTRTINDLRKAMPAGLAQWPDMREAERVKALLAAQNDAIGGH